MKKQLLTEAEFLWLDSFTLLLKGENVKTTLDSSRWMNDNFVVGKLKISLQITNKLKHSSSLFKTRFDITKI